jgi:hypothetical protein
MNECKICGLRYNLPRGLATHMLIGHGLNDAYVANYSRLYDEFNEKIFTVEDIQEWWLFVIPFLEEQYALRLMQQ